MRIHSVTVAKKTLSDGLVFGGALFFGMTYCHEHDQKRACWSRWFATQPLSQDLVLFLPLVLVRLSSHQPCSGLPGACILVVLRCLPIKGVGGSVPSCSQSTFYQTGERHSRHHWTTAVRPEICRHRPENLPQVGLGSACLDGGRSSKGRLMRCGRMVIVIVKLAPCLMGSLGWLSRSWRRWSTRRWTRPCITCPPGLLTRVWRRKTLKNRSEVRYNENHLLFFFWWGLVFLLLPSTQR
mmetsp:Transcript_13089/g.19295  ORF Transcript_13089/g.19295 Transcript_13089/m.19295 type:complete len:239 (+) Transcript_13089:298-1014(+)